MGGIQDLRAVFHVKILLITPALPHARNGNSVTALRWKRILAGLGHTAVLKSRYGGEPCDLMIALHALRSAESIRSFHEAHPTLPLLVTLTGTDLYRDIHTRSKAQESLELATRLIVLQTMALRELPKRFHEKTRVIYQSAAKLSGKPPRASNNDFQICVIGHLRPEKDPMRTAMAARRLPPSSRIRVIHVGRALSKEMEKSARAQTSANPRYRWLGELPHWAARRVLASSHLLSLTSRMEGSSNVLSEAIASSVPTVTTKIPGLVGTLGENYPGYFPVGDTRALADLLYRAETDPAFYRKLRAHCARLSPLVSPGRERAEWRKILAESD